MMHIFYAHHTFSTRPVDCASLSRPSPDHAAGLDRNDGQRVAHLYPDAIACSKYRAHTARPLSLKASLFSRNDAVNICASFDNANAKASLRHHSDQRDDDLSNHAIGL
jgi:hypothetical protein